MKRRHFLKAALGGTCAVAAPRLLHAQNRTTLKFIPQADLAVLDPIWTTADVTRNHAHLVFDTLFGFDASFEPHPQMAAGAQVDPDGKLWTITLRDGLRFHDGEPVLARDCVASLQRWGKRDVFGQVLFTCVDELKATSDTELRFRLRKPFALLPHALASTQNMAAIMPERLARTDPNQQVTEMVGSGPFRFLPKERVSGSRVAYERFREYRPRADGVPSFASGPKVAYLDRVEWTVIPDPATAASALATGEFDWWEQPLIDLLPTLKQTTGLAVAIKDTTGAIGCMRFNQLFPPFNNPDIRRLVLSAIDQREMMEAVAGADPSLIKVPVGLFATGTALASTAGLDAMKGLRDAAALRRGLEAAGYKGERVVVMVPADFPTINALGQVGAQVLKTVGLNVDVQSMDWGTLVQRRASKAPIDKGGWNVFFTTLSGTVNVSPATNLAVRANGADAWFGWPDLPKVEKIRAAWFDAVEADAQRDIARLLQEQAMIDIPYVPLGMFDKPTAYRNLRDIPSGFPLFYGTRFTV